MMENDRKTNIRETNMDVLKFFCMVAVVLNHTADYYSEDPYAHRLYTMEVQSFASIAVPLFLMITGSFLMQKDFGIVDFKRNTLDFWKASLRKFGLTTIIFTAFYMIWNTRNDIITMICVGGGTHGINVIRYGAVKLLTGFQGHPLWYMYTLFGIYLLLPGMCFLKNVIKPTNREYLSFCSAYICWGAAGIIIDTYGSSYSMGKVFALFSYILLGDLIHNVVPKPEKKNKIINYTFLLLAVCILILKGYLMYIAESWRNPLINSAGSPFHIIASALIFYFFCNTNMDKLKVKFVSDTFIVYLVHKAVLETIFWGVNNMWIVVDERIAIPIIGLITITISYVIAIIYKILSQKISLRN